MISLVRVDDRLVHAQVVVGWIEFLRCRRILVVDDQIVRDADRIDLFRMVIPDEVRVDACDTRSCAGRWADLVRSDEPHLMLFADPLSLQSAVDGGIQPREVNLGGMHEMSGRHAWIHGLFASDTEIAAIRRMMDIGIEFEIRSVPTSRRKDLDGDW